MVEYLPDEAADKFVFAAAGGSLTFEEVDESVDSELLAVSGA